MQVSDERIAPVFLHHKVDDAGLDVYAFRIYCRIARRAGSRGDGCTESLSNMAKGCKMGKRRAREALRELEDRGLVRTNERPGQTSEIVLTHRSNWKDQEEAPKPPEEPGQGSGRPDTEGERETEEAEAGQGRADEGGDGKPVVTSTGTLPVKQAPHLQERKEEGDEKEVDPVTGWAYEEMTHSQREEASKGWPLGQGVSDPKKHPGVQIHGEFYTNGTTDYQRRIIAKTLTDAVQEEQGRSKSRGEACEAVLQRWRSTLEFWKGNAYKGKSVKRQLEKFKELSKEARAEEAMRLAPGRANGQQNAHGKRPGWGRHAPMA